MVTTQPTREELIARLAAIERAIADRLVIVHEIIGMNREVIATYRRTVLLPRNPKEHRP